MEQYKICKCCNQAKSIDSFYKHKTNKDGFCSSCKKCVSEKAKLKMLNDENTRKKKQEYRDSRKEITKEYNKLYKQEKKEKIKELRKKYKSGEAGKLASKRYKEKHKEKILESAKIYRQSNRHKESIYRKIYNTRNPNAKKMQKARAVRNLLPSYIKDKIARNCEIKSNQIPEYLLEVKKHQILIKRSIKQLTKEIQNGTE